MSTRSGKRIHNSLLEDTTPAQAEPVVKSERKTRSKRVKENLEDLSVSLFKNKKRNNYVSYPTDDELLGDLTTKQEEESKSSRVLRKNALKEHNLLDNSEKVESQTEVKNLIRKSRRGKKLDDAEESENLEKDPTEVVELSKSKKSKKKKKANSIIENPPPIEEVASKKSKKKKKKGKKTSSMTVEEILQNDTSKSNMSIDSFHSAAGSPCNDQQTIEDGLPKKPNNTNETETPSKIIKKTNNTFDKNDASPKMSLDKENESKKSKKRKSITNETALGNCFVSITRDNLEEGLQNILNVSNMTNGQRKRRKSNAKDATFNKNVSSTDELNVESNLNVSNASNKQLKRRKSNANEVKDVSSPANISDSVDDTKSNDTFDKGLRSRHSVAKDSTFDKCNASITKETDKDDVIDLNVSNLSNKQNKTRKSAIKDSTFDKSNSSILKEGAYVGEIDLNVSKAPKGRKSILKDSTFDKSNASIAKDNIDEKDAEVDLNVSNSTKQLRRRLNIKDSTFDKQDTVLNTTFEKEEKSKKDSTFNKSKTLDATYEKVIKSADTSAAKRKETKSSANTTFDKTDIVTDSTFEKEEKNKKDSTFNKSKTLDATYEKVLESTDTSAAKRKETKSSANTTFDKTDIVIDSTFEKDISTSFDAFKKGAMTRKSSIRDATFDKSNISIASLTKEDFDKDNNIISSSARKRRSIRRQTFDKSDTITENVNTTYEKTSNTENELKRKSPRLSQSIDIQTKLNTTFEKENTEDGKENAASKSSLISSDNSNVTDDISRISITSDDTTENIVNTTPLLIESSIDESHVSITKQDSPKPQTPLKREGTFTKDGPEVQADNKVETPTKRQSVTVPTAGCTPYHITKSSQKKSVLNVTRSIEKGARVSVEPAPRMTRVMFCSPVDNPVAVAQEKRKVIKSNLKGSNKSFVFEETASIPRPARKRSYTQNDADDARVKRTRLTEDLKQSVDRLSRPRTTSATAKLSQITPKKPTTPSKPRSEGKPTRTKLPNFAAMHQKQFDKMESLDECQERKAKRAKQLLTPTAPPGLLDRISPKNNTDSPKGKEPAKPKEKTDTPTKKLPTLESLRPGFTRFGFKLNLDVNPFSIPSKTEKPKEKPTEKPVEKPVENKPLHGMLPRPAILPSLVGATSLRREAAKLTVMREKSFSEKRNVKRNENRTIIKGVRTNRRFELQMKLRNID